jgi:hypothetical protein
MTRNKTQEAHTVYVQRRMEDKIQTTTRKHARAAKAGARKSFGGAY